MKKVLVIGSLNMDIVTKVKSTPKVGETVSGNGLMTSAGGKGANQAVALGKLGCNVTMIGKVGDDDNGIQLKNNLTTMNVIDKVVVEKNTPTGTAFIMVNDNGDNSIVVIEGANGSLSSDEVEEKWFDGIDYVVMQHEIKEDVVFKILEIASKLNKTVFLNPAPARKLPSKYLKLIDYLVVNETEFEEITELKYKDENTLISAYEKIQVKNILLTLGEKGALFYNGSKTVYVEAQKVENVVDTTAAGDSFIAGFIYCLAKGDDIKSCMDFASKVAGYTVTKIGAQCALPYIDDIV